MRTLAPDDIAGIQSLYGVKSGGGGNTAPAMSSPTPGSTLAGSSQTFAWSAGSGVSAYRLSVGTSAGGNDLFDQNVGSSLTATVPGLPTSGGPVYVRLWWQTSAWNYADYAYTAASSGGGGGGGANPAITSPSAGSTLSGSSQTFTWTAGINASSYALYLGTATGKNDLFERSMRTALTYTVTGLPTDGRTIYARLWWVRNGAWEYADTTYTSGTGAGGGTGGGGGVNPAITSPSAGSTLSGSSQTFTWTAGVGASSYALYLGTATGKNDLFEWSMRTALTYTVTGLPTDGRTIYARLWWVRNGAWEYADTTYTAATGGGGATAGGGGVNPAITSPAAGSTLSGSSQTFTWTAGVGASSYALDLGTATGRNDLFERSMRTALTYTVTGLPTDGRIIYARLWWVRNGAWEYADTTYRSGP
jgi:hypothetical protein